MNKFLAALITSAFLLTGTAMASNTASTTKHVASHMTKTADKPMKKKAMKKPAKKMSSMKMSSMKKPMKKPAAKKS